MVSFEGVQKELKEIYEKKNADYGNSFEDSLNEFGTLPTAIRLNEKVNRLKSLCVGKQQVKDESIEDTLKDIANYCIITLKWLKNRKE